MWTSFTHNRGAFKARQVEQSSMTISGHLWGHGVCPWPYLVIGRKPCDTDTSSFNGRDAGRSHRTRSRLSVQKKNKFSLEITVKSFCLAILKNYNNKLPFYKFIWFTVLVSHSEVLSHQAMSYAWWIGWLIQFIQNKKPNYYQAVNSDHNSFWRTQCIAIWQQI